MGAGESGGHWVIKLDFRVYLASVEAIKVVLEDLDRCRVVMLDRRVYLDIV